MIDTIFIIILAIIAGIVSVRLWKKKNAWPLIVIYWIVLTAKNLTNIRFS